MSDSFSRGVGHFLVRLNATNVCHASGVPPGLLFALGTGQAAAHLVYLPSVAAGGGGVPGVLPDLHDAACCCCQTYPILLHHSKVGGITRTHCYFCSYYIIHCLVYLHFYWCTIFLLLIHQEISKSFSHVIKLCLIVLIHSH